MTTLRNEIERRLASNQVYYAHFVTNENMKHIRQDTTNDIFKLIEKRIDSIKNSDLYDSQERYVIEHLVKEMMKE